MRGGEAGCKELWARVTARHQVRCRRWRLEGLWFGPVGRSAWGDVVDGGDVRFGSLGELRWRGVEETQNRCCPPGNENSRTDPFPTPSGWAALGEEARNVLARDEGVG